MPIYDFLCADCGFLFENFYATLVEFDEIKKAGGIPCGQCDTGVMQVKPSRVAVKFAPVRDARGQLQPGSKREMAKKMEIRYKKRNARLEAMPREQQERFIKFMERMGCRKSPPSSSDTV